jgi:hypothetical protein
MDTSAISPFDSPATDQSLVSRQEIEMVRRKTKVLSAVAAAGLAGLAFVATKPTLALAETKGNPILLCQRFSGSDYTRVDIDDYQEGKLTKHTFKINHLDPDGCSNPGDYYWDDTLKVTWTESASGTWDFQQTVCDIPSVVNPDTKILCQPQRRDNGPPIGPPAQTGVPESSR